MKSIIKKNEIIKFVIITNIYYLKEIVNYLISNFDKDKISLELIIEQKTN